MNELPQASAQQLERRGKSIYLLIDPMRHDPTDQAGDRDGILALSKERPPKLHLINNPFIDRPPEKRLRLYRVEPGDELWQQSLAWAESDEESVGIGGWLYSDASMLMLGRHLERLMCQPYPGGKKALLRYFDPRVLSHLIKILDSQQLDALLGPITHWEYLDWNQQRQTVSKGESRQLHLKLENWQWQSIERISAINLCLSAWKDNIGGENLPDNASVRVQAFLEIADEYQIEDETDLIAFVLQGLGTSPEFYRHPMIAAILDRFQRGEASYIALTDKVTEEDWAAISAYRTRKDIEQ